MSSVPPNASRHTRSIPEWLNPAVLPDKDLIDELDAAIGDLRSNVGAALLTWLRTYAGTFHQTGRFLNDTDLPDDVFATVAEVCGYQPLDLMLDGISVLAKMLTEPPRLPEGEYLDFLNRTFDSTFGLVPPND